MIESIKFTNYKALRDATLPLSPFTLLLGPNGSGKSSVLQALRGIAALHSSRNPAEFGMVWEPMRSVTASDPESPVEIKLRLRFNDQLVIGKYTWQKDGPINRQINYADGGIVPKAETGSIVQWLGRMEIYGLDASQIALPSTVTSEPLQTTGAGLVAVLDDLKDNHSDRWEMLLAEMCRWLPEYDQIQFDKPKQGQKALALRTKRGGHRISADRLSQGTLISLALLTLAYLPNPPSLVALEEIDRSLHPRLLRHLQDALYRLSYPESCGESRAPIQVIATTHSPYLLDLYRDHPEEVVLAQKEGLEVSMTRLKDIEHYDEILGDSPLSEVWYSGVLGGASVKT